MHSRKWMVLVALCLGLASAAFADHSADHPDANVRVRIEIGRMQSGKKASVSSYVFVMSADGAPRVLTFGSRVPIPVTTFQAKDSDGKDQMGSSFTYQEIGMSTKFRASAIDDEHIWIEGTIDGSLLRQDSPRPGASTPPTMGNLRQELGILLRSGVPVRAAGVDEPGEGSVYVEVEASYLD